MFPTSIILCRLPDSLLALQFRPEVTLYDQDVVPAAAQLHTPGSGGLQGGEVPTHQ